VRGSRWRVREREAVGLLAHPKGMQDEVAERSEEGKRLVPLGAAVGSDRLGLFVLTLGRHLNVGVQLTKRIHPLEIRRALDRYRQHALLRQPHLRVTRSVWGMKEATDHCLPLITAYH
jgi:hypothetical protein